MVTISVVSVTVTTEDSQRLHGALFAEFLCPASPWSYLITSALAPSVAIDHPKVCTKYVLTELCVKDCLT